MQKPDNTPKVAHKLCYTATDANGLLHMRARYYNPNICRFLNPDPIGLAGGLNLYAYANGDPIQFTDSSGLWFGIDDAIFSGVGGILGVGGRFVGDLITGNRSTWEDYTGAFVGGAAGGETLLYTANPFAAGAVGGAVGNLTTQGLKLASGKQDSFNGTSLVIDTGLGAATGFIPGRPKIPGINAGRGSDLQIFRQILTKAENGTINNVTTETAARMAAGAFYEYGMAPGAGASSIGSTLASEIPTWFSPSQAQPAYIAPIK